MSVQRTTYGGPREVTMSAGVRGGPPPPPPKPLQQRQEGLTYSASVDEHGDLAKARGRLSVAGARFYKPSSQPTPGHRWNLQQLRASEAIVPLQSGTNNFESQKGDRAFGTPRNTTTAPKASNPELIPSEAELAMMDEGGVVGRWEVATLRKGQGIVIGQAGSNQFASQKGSTGFGSRRDVNGKHMKRIWELEYPEDCLPHV